MQGILDYQISLQDKHHIFEVKSLKPELTTIKKLCLLQFLEPKVVNSSYTPVRWKL